MIGEEFTQKNSIEEVIDEEMESIDVQDYLNVLMESYIDFKNIHWKTRSSHKHKVLDVFSKEILETIDDLVETLIGVDNIEYRISQIGSDGVLGVYEEGQGSLGILEELRQESLVMKQTFENQDGYYVSQVNIIEDFIRKIDKTTYLLRQS